MSKMTKSERVRAAFAGEPTDRTPVSLWGHFTSDPQTAGTLAAESVAFQKEFDWDFIKLMPSGAYYPHALGSKITPAQGPDAVNFLEESSIKYSDDFATLPVPDVSAGTFFEVIEAVRITREAVGPEIPIFQTIFSPLTIIHKLATSVDFHKAIRNNRPAVEEGLRRITLGNLRLIEQSVRAGADGFFFATQDAYPEAVTEEEYIALARPSDLVLLRAMGELGALRLLHVCRTDIYVHLVADYPVEAVNWDSVNSGPSIGAARAIWPGKTLVGGLDRNGALVKGKPEEVKAEVRRAMAEGGERGFIVAANCTLPTARTDDNLRAARQAVEKD